MREEGKKEQDKKGKGKARKGGNSASFFELVKKRYSVRRYSGEPVAREKIERCLEATPCTVGLQLPALAVIVVDEPERREGGAGHLRTIGPV